MEYLGLYYKIILISKTCLYVLNFVAREARHDTVNKRGAHKAVIGEPTAEVLTKVPQVNVLVYALFKFMTVEENQFARENYPSFVGRTVECFEAVIKQLCEFAGV